VVPFALIALLVAPWFLAGPIYETAFFAQVAFYGLSILGGSGWKLGPVSRLVDAAFTFVSLNTAALVAFANFITGHTTVWMQPPLRKEMRA
jgi:hypothetical protein